MEIVNQLRGQVTDRFVRECLDEKYKQKTREENARKQQSKKGKEIDKLAEVTPLNQQEVEEKEKEEVVIVDVNGRTSIQEDDDEEKEDELSTTTDSKTDKNFAPASYQQGGQQSKNQANHGLEETSDENHELKEDQKSSPIITTDKMVTDVPATTYDNEVNTDNDILSCEFSMSFKKIRNYITPLLSKMENNRNVWFNIRVDKKNGHVISSDFGRMAP